MQRGTTWCPRIGTWRRQKTQGSVINRFRFVEKRSEAKAKWLPLLVTLQLSLFQRQVCRLPHSAARIGSPCW